MDSKVRAKKGILIPTKNMWVSHDGSPQQFIRYLIFNIQHTINTGTHQTYFYIFKKTMSPPRLLSYAASNHLDIVSFDIPNEPEATYIDFITMQHIQKKRKSSIDIVPLKAASKPPLANTKLIMPKPALKTQPS